MCWLTKAWPSTTRVTVFFRSAPTASSGRVDRQFRHGAGSVAARAPQNDGPESADARDGIVDAARDGALADEERVGHAGQPVEGILLVVSDGLAGAVGAGHHQHVGRAGGEEQMVQRRVGQHYAEFVVVGSDARQLDLRLGASTIGRATDVSRSPLPATVSTIKSRARRRPSPSPRMVSPCDTFARAAHSPPRHCGHRRPGDIHRALSPRRSSLRAEARTVRRIASSSP